MYKKNRGGGGGCCYIGWPHWPLPLLLLLDRVRCGELPDRAGGISPIVDPLIDFELDCPISDCIYHCCGRRGERRLGHYCIIYGQAGPPFFLTLTNTTSSTPHDNTLRFTNSLLISTFLGTVFFLFCKCYSTSENGELRGFCRTADFFFPSAARHRIVYTLFL